MIRFTSDKVTVTAAKSDGTGERRIDAIAVPYDTWATVSDGTTVRFMPGSLPVDGKAPRVFMFHDSTMPVGIVSERVDTPEAMLASMRISKTALGNDALELAADGIMDVSVGVNPIRAETDSAGRVTVYEAEWLELSLVPIPAFAGSVITEVAAAATVDGEPSAEDLTPDDNAEPQIEESQVEATPAPAAVEAEAVIPTAPIPAQPKRKFAMPSAAEYLAAYHAGGEVFRRVNEAFIEARKDQYSAFQAAAGDVATTDLDGLLPVPVLGPVFQDLNYIRPTVAAVGTRGMPDGGRTKTFIRPTWNTHTGVAAQSPELNPVNAVTPIVDDNVIEKTTIAGGVTLSVQSMDFTSPDAMEIILRDLAGQYLIGTDDFLCTGIETDAGASGNTWTVTANDPSSLVAALYDTAESMLSATNFLPDTLMVSSDVWSALSQQLDDANRPVFPYVGAAGLMGVNGMGTQNITTTSALNPFGLNLIADANFSAGTIVLARANAVEFYEQVRGIMSKEDPSLLGRTFSYYGYVAYFIANSTLVQSIAFA